MSNLDMSEAVRMLAEHHGISVDALLQVLVEALATAYKKRPNAADEVIVGINPENLDMTFTAYDVDEDGNWVNERDDTPKREEMGRIAAQTFRQVMSQRIREAERDRKFEEYANREGDIVTGIIQQTDSRYTLLDLGKVEALLPQAEQVPFERPQPGDRVKAYIVEVRKTAKGPQIVVSRTHPGLIKRLFELEVPEIADGVVEIRACAREPGHRTKIAVWSNDGNVDPVSQQLLTAGLQSRRGHTDQGIHVAPEAEISALLREVVEAHDGVVAGEELQSELRSACNRVEFANRFYNDAVEAAQGMRNRPIVKYVGLAGHTAYPMPLQFDVLAPEFPDS